MELQEGKAMGNAGQRDRRQAGECKEESETILGECTEKKHKRVI